MRSYGGAPSRPQAYRFALHFPGFARGSNHKTDHYKQPFDFVSFVAEFVWWRPQCGRHCTQKAPHSTASKGCSPLVHRSGEQLRTVQGVALFLFYYFIVGGVKSGSGNALGLYLLRCRKSPPRSIATLDTGSMFVWLVYSLPYPLRPLRSPKGTTRGTPARERFYCFFITE